MPMKLANQQFKEIEIKLEKDIEAEESLILTQKFPPTAHFDELNLIKNELPIECEDINENSIESDKINLGIENLEKRAQDKNENKTIDTFQDKNESKEISIINNEENSTEKSKNLKKVNKTFHNKTKIIDRSEKLQSKKRKNNQIEDQVSKRIKIEPNEYFEKISPQNHEEFQCDEGSYFEITEIVSVKDFKNEELKIKDFTLKLKDISKEIAIENLFREIDVEKLTKLQNSEITYKKSNKTLLKNENFKENKSETFNLENCKILGSDLESLKKLFHCKKCSASFNKKISLDRHQMIHVIPKFTCSKCNIKFKKKKSFENHKCNICIECDKQFESQSKLLSHIRNVHTDESKLELFTCDICGKSSKYFNTLIRHVLSHRSEADINCDHCEKKVKSEIALREHVRSCHSRELITCKICNKQMKPQCIYQHMKLVHTKIRNFHCNLCQASFKTKEKLARHSQTHDKKFNCEICERKFSSNYELTEHMMRHENPNIFSCNICKKSFSTRTSLNTHSKLHKNIERNLKCQHCDFVTHKIESLRYHLTTHEKKKQKMKKEGNWLKCEKCDAILKTRASLWGHYKKVHQTERFQCDYCGIKIKTKYSMKKHLENKHKF